MCPGAGALAVGLRFESHGEIPLTYLALTCALPVLWVGAVALAGGYEPRFIGVGSDEFRRVLNASVHCSLAWRWFRTSRSSAWLVVM